MSLELWLRAAGASLVGLALLHAVLWRALNWDREVALLTPLNARVFAVHTFFIAFVLFALGALSFFRPELLLEKSELGRWVLVGIVFFWIARLALQPLVFDRVMREGWTRQLWVRLGAGALFGGYVIVYAAALVRQYAVGAP